MGHVGMLFNSVATQALRMSVIPALVLQKSCLPPPLVPLHSRCRRNYYPSVKECTTSELSCLNNCNKRGTCVSGWCHCKPGAHRVRRTARVRVLGVGYVRVGWGGFRCEPRLNEMARWPLTCNQHLHLDLYRFMAVRAYKASIISTSPLEGFFGADCSLSLDAEGKPELLAGTGYATRAKRPWVYVYELPPDLTTWWVDGRAWVGKVMS